MYRCKLVATVIKCRCKPGALSPPPPPHLGMRLHVEHTLSIGVWFVMHSPNPIRNIANVCGPWCIIHMTPASLPQALMTALVCSSGCLLPPSSLCLSFVSPSSHLNSPPFSSLSPLFPLSSFPSSTKTILAANSQGHIKVKLHHTLVGCL